MLPHSWLVLGYERAKSMLPLQWSDRALSGPALAIPIGQSLPCLLAPLWPGEQEFEGCIFRFSVVLILKSEGSNGVPLLMDGHHMWLQGLQQCHSLLQITCDPATAYHLPLVVKRYALPSHSTCSAPLKGQPLDSRPTHTPHTAGHHNRPNKGQASIAQVTTQSHPKQPR